MRTTKPIVPVALLALITAGGSAVALTSTDRSSVVGTSPGAVRSDIIDVRDGRVLASHAVFQASAPMLDKQFAPIQPGMYRLDVGELEVSLDFAADHWVVQQNLDAVAELTDAGPAGPFGRDILLLAPARPSGAPDIDAWLEANADALEGAPVEARLSGYVAIRFDVDRTTTDSDAGIDFIKAPGAVNVTFEPGSTYRVWWLDDVEGSPFAVIVSSDGSSHPLLHQAEMLLETMAFETAL